MKMSESVPVSATQGFISYRRDDNDNFSQVVDRLHADLQSTYEAMTGKRVESFKDRESIGWGEDWRLKIASSVERATVFIPVITMRYFTSQSCVDELLLFHATAKRLGVTDLIMPIVLFGADQIGSDDPREEVRLISRLNYKSIESAWKSGYASSEWRTVIVDCVSELDTAIGKAEDSLAAEEIEEERGSSGGPLAVVSEVSDGDDSAGADLSELGVQFEAIEPLASEAAEAVQALGDQAKSAFGDDFSKLGAKESKIVFLNAARDLRVPALEMRESSKQLESRMVDIDGALRSLVEEMSAIKLPLAQEQLHMFLENFQGVDELAQAEGQVGDLVEMLQFASLMNINLRKTLRPAIAGLRSMQTAIGIFRSWDDLADV